MEITFERNWCDCLTECPHKKGIMVGSYECVVKCKHCTSHNEDIRPERDRFDGAKYFDIWKGTVDCNYE